MVSFGIMRKNDVMFSESSVKSKVTFPVTEKILKFHKQTVS